MCEDLNRDEKEGIEKYSAGVAVLLRCFHQNSWIALGAHDTIKTDTEIDLILNYLMVTGM